MKKSIPLLFICALFLSCSKSTQPPPEALLSVPVLTKALEKNDRHFEFIWLTRDSLVMYAQGWRPDSAPRAVVCVFHGLGEHSGRYGWMGEFLSDSGFVVLVGDIRGHGRSQGQRGHFPDYNLCMDDMTLFIKEIKKEFKAMPIFLYGQSLGGNFVINYVLRNSLKFTGSIASAPLLRTGFKPPAWKIFLGKMMYYIWPTLSLSNGVDPNNLCRDPSVVQSRLEDTLCHTRVTSRFIGIFDAGEWALQNAYRLDTPLLIMHGTADRVTSISASRQFAEKAGALCTFKKWRKYYHTLHEEQDREKVFRYCISWMRKQLSE